MISSEDDEEQTWLFGTEDLTLLDIHCGAVWEKIFLIGEHGAYPELFARLNWEETAPSWCKYMRRFRDHEVIRPLRMHVEVHRR